MTHAVSSAEIVALQAEGRSHREIAATLNISKSTVEWRLRRPHVGLPSARCREIIAAYLSAGSLSAAARSLGISPPAVHQTVARYERATGEKLPRYQRGGPGRKP